MTIAGGNIFHLGRLDVLLPASTEEDPAESPPCAKCAEKDQIIADQAKTLERVTSELKWHGLDDEALTVAQGYEMFERARGTECAWLKYRNQLAPMLRAFAAIPCLQMTPQRWDEHRAMRSREKVGRYKDHKPTSWQLDLELGAAKMMLRWLVRSGQLPRNPLDLARKVRAPNGRETYLEESDIGRLYDGAEALRIDGAGRVDDRRVLMFQAFLLVKFGCALRFDEVRTLRRDRIGPDGVVELSAKATKGKKRRTVALTEQAHAAVRAVPPLGLEPYVFSSRKGGTIHLLGMNTARSWFHVVCKATGISARAVAGERVVPHVLRHSAASHAEAMGAHPMDIRDFLGHTSITTTEQYLHRRPAQRAIKMRDLMSKAGNDGGAQP